MSGGDDGFTAGTTGLYRRGDSVGRRTPGYIYLRRRTGSASTRGGCQESDGGKSRLFTVAGMAVTSRRDRFQRMGTGAYSGVSAYAGK